MTFFESGLFGFIDPQGKSLGKLRIKLKRKNLTIENNETNAIIKTRQ